MRFHEQLEHGWRQGKFVCVGLDPDPRSIASGDVARFTRAIIEATADVVLAYKPQSAYFEALGTDGPAVLKTTIDTCRELAPGVPVILDAKRADIGSTNNGYVSAAFDFYGADAITVHPYLGPEAMKPFLDREDKGVIVLCRTSNAGAGRYQDLTVGHDKLYEYIARDVAETWNYNYNCALVTGATAPREIRDIRAITELPLLVPGIGAQGGDLESTLHNGLDANGAGLIISSSRAIIYADDPRAATLQLDNEIRSLLSR